ncbi:DUF2971 domain-containing protein [Yunchengibacter salinarum]|uniref:DUF2971 domain-containing protein n=1 Tax=Yunchengibacter salinarum TaxID=3133399 RepID=UPI0035B578B0
MILYKYLSFCNGLKVIKGNKISFTQPDYFNDPFDAPIFERSDSSDYVSRVLGNIRSEIKSNVMREKYGILSLTRLPNNPLMWAHYAESHEGIVIGINIKKAGFLCEKTNFIPASFGSVIYSNSRPGMVSNLAPEHGLRLGDTHAFPREHYEKLQNLFLTKPMCWAYEEEVRVVKCLNGISSDKRQNDSGNFDFCSLENNKELYLYKLPDNSIEEVYVGVKMNEEQITDLRSTMTDSIPGRKLYRCALDNKKYTINSFTE